MKNQLLSRTPSVCVLLDQQQKQTFSTACPVAAAQGSKLFQK